MKSLLLDVENCEVTVIEIENSPELEFFYEHLTCDVIDITERRINGEYFKIVCDDEGALKNFPIVSAINSNMDPMLFGNLMFFRGDPDTGELVGLTDEDIEHIRSSIHGIMATYRFKANSNFSINGRSSVCRYNPILVGCEY